MSSSKLKRKKHSSDSPEKSIVRKKRSVSFEEDLIGDGQEVDGLEEQSHMLGQVTGQIRRLPLEDGSKVKGEQTPRKRRKRCREGGSDEGESKDARSTQESSVDKFSAAQYLVLWDSDQDSWSFKKKTQYWLLQNMYYKPSVSKLNFSIMLRYLEGLQGNQRNLVLEKARDLIKEKEPIKEEVPEAKWIYKRAVKVAQVLSN